MKWHKLLKIKKKIKLAFLCNVFKVLLHSTLLLRTQTRCPGSWQRPWFITSDATRFCLPPPTLSYFGARNICNMTQMIPQVIHFLNHILYTLCYDYFGKCILFFSDKLNIKFHLTTFFSL